MRSQRRLRLYIITVVAFLLALAYYTTDSGGGVQDHHFYKSTVTAMDDAHAATLKKNSAAAKDRSHIQRLDIDNNNGGGARKQSSLNSDKQEKIAVADSNKIDNDDGTSAYGRTKPSIPKPKEEDQVHIQTADEKLEASETTKAESASASASVISEPKHEALSEEELEEQARKEEEAKKEEEATAELDSILKRSPIIVFSKSYCPFSKKAKHILSQYSIEPAPYVVELDQHHLGPHLQKLLARVTGRRTVPNVLINGRSIGGGDDLAALDSEDALISKIKSLAGKSLMEMKHLPKPAHE